MRRLRIVLLFVATAVATASLLLAGCGGAECGENTVEQDGECVLEAEVCAEGTVFQNGECVPEEEIECADGTVLENGQCVPAGCPDGEVAKNGECVPEVDCGENTTLDDQNRCVVEDPVDCGNNTELDPNTNECIVTDAICGDNTAFSADDDACVPTEDVCDEGTHFDGDTGLCLPDAACQPGDVVSDGYCVSQGQWLYDNAEYEADGVTDPSFEGVPLEVEIGDPDEPAIFNGTIDPPEDLSDDGTDDQHMDFFQFSADEGDWFDVSVYALGDFTPVFQIMSASDPQEGYTRMGPLLTGTDRARHIVIPEEGEYYLLVLPESSLLTEFNPPFGADDWDYSGQIQRMERPDAEVHDFEDENFTGELGPLDENYVLVDQYDDTQSLVVDWESVPDTAGIAVQAWAGPEEFLGEFEDTSFSVDVPDSEEVYFIFDWTSLIGLEGHDFEIAVEAVTTLEDGQQQSADFTADENDGVRVQVDHDGDDSQHVEVAILDDSDNTITSETVAPGMEMTHYDLAEGDYTVTFTNETGGEMPVFQHEIDVTARETLTTFSADAYDNVEMTQVNDDEAPIYLSVRHDVTEDIVHEAVLFDSSGLFPFVTSFYADSGGDYTVYLFNFEEATNIDLDVEFGSGAEVGTFTVESDDVGDILEVSHNQTDPVELSVIYDGNDETLEGGTFDEEGILSIVAPLEGDYTVMYYDSEGTGPAGDDIEITTEFVAPQAIDFEDTVTGSSTEDLFSPHDFYVVEPDESGSYDVVLEHLGTSEGSSGWAVVAIYSLGHDQLEMSPQLDEEGQVTSVEMEFAEGATYIIRVGNYFTLDWTFDYQLSFEEL